MQMQWLQDQWSQEQWAQQQWPPHQQQQWTQPPQQQSFQGVQGKGKGGKGRQQQQPQYNNQYLQSLSQRGMNQQPQYNQSQRNVQGQKGKGKNAWDQSAQFRGQQNVGRSFAPDPRNQSAGRWNQSAQFKGQPVAKGQKGKGKSAQPKGQKAAQGQKGQNGKGKGAQALKQSEEIQGAKGKNQRKGKGAKGKGRDKGAKGKGKGAKVNPAQLGVVCDTGSICESDNTECRADGDHSAACRATLTEGKAGFKDDIAPARNIIIENGSIDRSPHGAIHGNDNDHVLIRDLTIKDFAVAPIAINIGRNMVMKRVVMENVGLQVPVHSNFAITWMLNRTLTNISATADYSNATRAQANEYLTDADLLDILESPGSDKHRLTENKSGKPEWSMFGIYLSSKFNVGTLDRGVLSKYSQNVLIQNVQIQHVATGVYEMDDKPMLDSFSNRAHWTFLYDNTGARLPLTTTLNRLKYNLAKMAVWSTSIAKPEKMPKIFVDAILDKDNLAPSAYEAKIFPQAGTGSRAGHSPKGTFGICLDGVRNVRMENCTIENIANNDTPGSVIDKNKVVYPACPTVWRGTEGNKQVYKGNYAFGISLSSCVSVDVVQSKVANVRSENGNAFGMAFIGPTRAVSASQVDIANTMVNSEAYEKVPAALPNLEAKAMVWYKEEEASDIQFREVTAKAIPGFKDEIAPARNVVSENGIIGRSPHGAIHDNDNDLVLTRDLTIKDFEVAATAINNERNMVLLILLTFLGFLLSVIYALY